MGTIALLILGLCDLLRRTRVKQTQFCNCRVSKNIFSVEAQGIMAVQKAFVVLGHPVGMITRKLDPSS